ncbi:MAG: DNA polymerase IV [Firmicutes bacterium]|nr:DNA polymerase IV [Bacillota bacterium]
MGRSIIHVDMDAFFASVEQRDDPSLKGRPVIVGHPLGGRGVVSAASYEARPYGVRSGMPLTEALKLCPHASVVPPDHARYSRVSRQLRAIYLEYTPLVEPLSLDEAFLDVTGSRALFGPPESIGRAIKDRILSETALRASIGIAPNKFLAKVASDLRKPDGFVTVMEEGIGSFLAVLAVERLWGVGPATAAGLRAVGLRTVGEVAAAGEKFLSSRFGRIGKELHLLSLGIDPRPVVPFREARSIGAETTFPVDLRGEDELHTALLGLAERVARRLRRTRLLARTVVLKVRFPDFQTVSRSRTLAEPTAGDPQLYRAAGELLEEALKGGRGKGVRLLGVTGKNLVPGSGVVQSTLFEEPLGERHPRENGLSGAIDRIVDRFGEDSITWARLIRLRQVRSRRSVRRSGGDPPGRGAG